MLQWLSYFSKSIAAFRDGGVDTFLWRALMHLRKHTTFGSWIHEQCIFRPSIPPIGPIGLRRNYIHNYVFPHPEDTVVEVGAYHGKDTAMFAKLSNTVIAFEPSPRNYQAATRNLRRFENVKLVNKGLWSAPGHLDLQYGVDSTDDGFLTPDSGATGDRTQVEVNRLDKYMDDLRIYDIDFLKIEAEGAEPEVLEGIGALEVDKICINVGPERDGKSTAPEVSHYLREHGFRIVATDEVGGNVIYAISEKMEEPSGVVDYPRFIRYYSFQ